MRHLVAVGLALSLTACFPKHCPPPPPAPDPCALPPCGQDQAAWDAFARQCVPAGTCHVYTCPGTDAPVSVCTPA